LKFPGFVDSASHALGPHRELDITVDGPPGTELLPVTQQFE